MKLKDILVEKIDLSKATLVNFQGKKWMPISGDLAGKGAQARVYHTGQGMVTKHVVLDDDKDINDPNVKFLNIVLDHQDNPFFPKIYHARVYRDKEGIQNPILIVQMEKLIPIYNTKIADATAHLYQQLGLPMEDDTPRRRLKSQSVLDSNQQRVISQADSFFNLTRTMGGERMDKFAEKSNNPKFREAMKVLMPAMKKHGSDLHFGNWMVRLTSVGPQLVIIDPFAPSNTSNF